MEVGERLVEMRATTRAGAAGAMAEIRANVARQLDQHPERIEPFSPTRLQIEAKLIHLDVCRIAPD